MDLAITVQDTIIYIRVAALVKTSRGFLFERSKKGYIFLPGGKVKLGESSEDAIKREIMEEIGMKAERTTLVSILENFYFNDKEKVQEICFVFKIDEDFTGIIPDGFTEVSIEDISKYDVRPKPMVDILKNKDKLFKHIIIK